MKRSDLTRLLTLAALICPLPAAAQTAQPCTPDEVRGGSALTVQPTIIVIPFTKEGEDMRTVFESDVNRRVAATAVKQGFDNVGFSTVDLVAVMRAVATAGAMTTGTETDLKTRIIEQSRADIYVEVEVLEPERQGDLTNVSIIRTAYLTNNGMSLANMIGHSGRYRGIDLPRLVERAAADSLDAFLAVMQEKFDDVVQNGAVISVDVSVRQGAAHDLASEVGSGGDVLGFVLEDWFAENAWQNNYSISGSTDVRMILDAVRVPLRDPETCRNYNVSQFGRELVRYLRSLGVRAQVTISRGSLYVEIQ